MAMHLQQQEMAAAGMAPPPQHQPQIQEIPSQPGIVKYQYCTKSVC